MRQGGSPPVLPPDNLLWNPDPPFRFDWRSAHRALSSPIGR